MSENEEVDVDRVDSVHALRAIGDPHEVLG